ncbi:lysylphosphatidylglycerol synthase transmembrane domain-containing protein [Allorhizobium terrae]|uniref:lysylphosphatidylglycerol synthase transmembrane domain-containing protein n=1 Tax=Allorhizobium terrae TaxID=1848972 RepID=UPI001E3F35F6|nr:lysylphosphatidylglycerol synthase transmembrane domain-containing protein [Allorhizobium terrae]
MPAPGILTIAFCFALVAGLILAVDPAKIVAAFANVPPGHILAGLLIVQLQVILSAVRWRFTAQRLGHDMPLGLAVREYYLGSFLNQILPGGMAGDAVRAYRATEEGEGGWKRPAAAVVLERLSGQIAFFALTGIGLVVWPFVARDHLPKEFASLVWICLSLALVVAGLAVGFGKARLPARLRGLKPDLMAAFWQDRAFAVQTSLSVTIVASYVATFFIAASAVGTPLPAIAAVTVIPLCLLTMLIPVSVGGWGTREAAAASLWPLLGFTSAQGFSASVLYGLFSVIGVAPVGIALVLKGLWARKHKGR